jgi:putative methyltransferase (TIGR04325 family)
MGWLKSKRWVKDWLPPAVLALYRRWRKEDVSYEWVSYDGNYSSWQDALANSTGYDSDLILEKVSTALLKVKSGEAVYERDSVLFDRIEYPFPLLAGLFRVAASNEGKLTVLDFGGSLGSTYFQCRDFLSAIPKLAWGIVEQEIFVRRGRELFETDQLQFFFSIQECMGIMQPNVVLFSSVLQYIQTPFELLKTAMGTEAQYIIIDRTPFSNSDKDELCVQHVSPQIYPASYPCWIFSEPRFRQFLLKQFKLIADFDGADGCAHVGESPFCFKGMIWERR